MLYYKRTLTIESKQKLKNPKSQLKYKQSLSSLQHTDNYKASVSNWSYLERFKDEFNQQTNEKAHHHQTPMKKIKEKYQTIDRWKLRYNAQNNRYFINLKQSLQKSQFKLPFIEVHHSIDSQKGIINKKIGQKEQLSINVKKLSIQQRLKQGKQLNGKIQKQYNFIHPRVWNSMGMFIQLEDISSLSKNIQPNKTKKKKIRINISEQPRGLLISRIVKGNPGRWDIAQQYNDDMHHQRS